MIKHLFILALVMFLHAENKVPIGEFASAPGNEHYRLKLNQDSTFKQYFHSCMERTMAEGRWTLDNDTIILNASTIYFLRGRWKKIRINSNSRTYKEFANYHNKVLPVGEDTLLQVRLHHFRNFKLVRKH